MRVFRGKLRRGGRIVHPHRGTLVGAVVGETGAAAGGRHEAACARPRARRAQFRVSRLRQAVQAQVVAEEPPKVGMRQGAPVPVSVLRVPRQAEDAHRATHGAHAPRSPHEAGPVHQAGQRGRVHLARHDRATTAPRPHHHRHVRSDLISPCNICDTSYVIVAA